MQLQTSGPEIVSLNKVLSYISSLSLTTSYSQWQLIPNHILFQHPDYKHSPNKRCVANLFPSDTWLAFLLVVHLSFFRVNCVQGISNLHGAGEHCLVEKGGQGDDTIFCQVNCCCGYLFVCRPEKNINWSGIDMAYI